MNKRINLSKYTILNNAVKSINNSFIHETKRIGKQSAYGKIYEINNKYVIKYIPFRHKHSLKSFQKEVSIGSIKGIEKVGPKVLAYKIVKDPVVMEIQGQKLYGEDYGIIIMQNMKKGKDVILQDLKDYLNKHICVSKKSKIYNLLIDKLVKFYNITEGYHGDLHSENIMLIKDSKTNEILDLMIFDYGSYRKFTNFNIKKCKSIYEIFEKIQKQFNKSIRKSNNSNQPYRSNKAMFNKLNLSKRFLNNES